MCGICGIVDPQSGRIEPVLLSKLNKALFHRGPDEGGEWVEGSAGLAMRRLAIIDLTSGQQPIFNEDESLAIVFNGEIYNYVELKAPLEAAGHKFKTNSDTEVILHLYEQHGIDALKMLNGMFAIAIWNRRTNELLVARDRVGKKPVYYCLINGRLVFSSEMTSLLEHPEISRDVDLIALDNYFALGYTPPPRTIFKQVRQLEPGSYLTWKDGQIKTDRYWRLEVKPTRLRSEEEAAEELLKLLKDAVRIRLRSDVPFGALLSGGVDSGLVVGLMSEQMSRPVQTFTMGFEDKSVDESDFAAEVAKHFGTDHHVMIARPHTAIELLEKMTAHFGEPFADASSVPTFLVSELARQHVTVALSGDGGDEVFGGYRSYGYHVNAENYKQLPSPVRAGLRGVAGMMNGGGGTLGQRLKRFVKEAELPVADRWLNSRSIFTDAQLNELYTERFANSGIADERGFGLRNSFEYFTKSEDALSSMNHVDYETYLPGDILVKVDRMSMANSLELRAPLLDYRVAEFGASLPRDWKWNGKEGKLVLKRAAAKILPQSALTRKKQGFVTPIGPWLRDELQPVMRDAIRRSKAGDLIRLDYCEKLLDRHVAGEGGGIDRRLWSILCFLLWHEKFAA